MRLSARMLDNVSSVNSFAYVDQVEFTEGDATRVYFQLIDVTQDKGAQGFKPAGRRYMPAAGATLSVTLENIDDDKAITRAASQYSALDPSIWYVTIMATDVIRGTVNLALALTQSSVVTRGRVEAAVAISPSGTL